ncbi:MAG: hypothetical protein ACMXX9_04345 [Candidatus Woesearchaeota archaeon]
MELDFYELRDFAYDIDLIIKDNSFEGELTKKLELSEEEKLSFNNLEMEVSNSDEFYNSYNDVKNMITLSEIELSTVYYDNISNNSIHQLITTGLSIGAGIFAGLSVYNGLPESLNEVSKVMASGTLGFLAGSFSGLVFDSFINKANAYFNKNLIERANYTIDKLPEYIDTYNEKYDEFCSLLEDKKIEKPEFLERTNSTINELLKKYNSISKGYSK